MHNISHRSLCVAPVRGAHKVLDPQIQTNVKQLYINTATTTHQHNKHRNHKHSSSISAGLSMLPVAEAPSRWPSSVKFCRDGLNLHHMSVPSVFIGSYGCPAPQRWLGGSAKRPRFVRSGGKSARDSSLSFSPSLPLSSSLSLPLSPCLSPSLSASISLV